jgi:2-keto-3-deoxy-L-rhamnonate aldolase RhmA
LIVVQHDNELTTLITEEAGIIATHLRENKLRELIRHGKPTFGTHVLSTWPGMVEVIGYSHDVDYLEFDAEYAPFDLYDLDNIARACELTGMSSMMKVDQEPRTFLATRALGSGIQSILFADIRTVEDAELCVSSVKMETPEDRGLHGCHMRRSVRYLHDIGSKDYVGAMNDVVIAFMIEKKSAVDKLEEILSVPGLDMVQFGPCDYSISAGVPGEFGHRKVREAELKVIKTAVKMGIRPRVELGGKIAEEEVQKYSDLGVKDFCLGWDVGIIHDWIRENLPKARRASGHRRARPP